MGEGKSGFKPLLFLSNEAGKWWPSPQTSLSSTYCMCYLGSSGKQPYAAYSAASLCRGTCMMLERERGGQYCYAVSRSTDGRRYHWKKTSECAAFGWSCAEEGHNPRQRSQEISLPTPLLEGRITHAWAALDSCLYNLFFKTSNAGDFTVSLGGLFGQLTTLKTRKFFINILCCKLSRFKKISTTMLLRPKAQLF